MDHLGERLSALVDGELDHTERDKALSHIAGCDSCKLEAETLRQLKRRLHGMETPEPSTDLLSRLSALSEAPLAESPWGPPPGGAAVSGPRPNPGVARTIGSGPPSSAGGGPSTSGVGGPATPARTGGSRGRVAPALARLRPRWGGARYAAAGVSMVALTLGTAFIAGEPEQAPVVQPALEEFAVEHAVTSQAPALPPSLPIDADTTVHTPVDRAVAADTIRHR